MNQIAVLVDAGYFWVQAGFVVHNRLASREEVTIDYVALRQEVLEKVATQFPAATLLRVYWYDGPGSQGSKTPAHHAIDELDDFKLRLGTRNGVGNQKAVDGLIITDLVGLAQSKSIQGALLVSGDADLTPGVIAAQSLGIRIHLLSMGPHVATSPYLRAEVDLKSYWADPTVLKFASSGVPQGSVNTGDQGVIAGSASVSASPNTAVEPASTELCKAIVAKTLSNLGHPDKRVEFDVNGGLLPYADGKLLWIARGHLGRELLEVEKRSLRRIFKKEAAAPSVPKSAPDDSLDAEKHKKV